MRKNTEQNTTVNNGGLGFSGLLGILFIALKLTGVITWSWWLVTLPLWGGVALVLLIATIVFLYVLITD